MNAFTIVVTVPSQAPRRLTFSQARVTIGRDAGDVVVGDPLCSSQHAELLWHGDRLVYRDLGSTNGSFLLGQRISQVELVPGAVIQIGGATLQFEAGGAPTQPGSRRTSTPTAVPQPPARAAGPVAPPAAGSRRVLLVAVGVAGAAAVVVLAAGAWLATSKASRARLGDLPPAGFIASTPAIPKGGEATVKAVWFRGQPGVKVEGGTADITVRVAPNPNAGASVGVIEEFAGGTGNQWRTASWLAAFNASRATGSSLIDHEYLVRAGGHIDGPSAGMLMTATMMALLRGTPLKPATTMTGTINPDGSAGPVGGIAQKMEGAKRDGIARFGYPMGARNHKDLATLTDVDLEELGSRLGLEVKEIHDVYEAYEFVTGEALTRPTPLDEAGMELDSETTQRLRAKVTAWKARLDGEVASLGGELRRDARTAASARALLDKASEMIKAAQVMEKSDLPAAALWHYTRAGLTLVLARDTLAFAGHLLDGDLKAIQSQVAEATAVSGQVKAFGDELLVRSKKQTVGGQVNATLAFSTYVGASNFAALAENAKARAQKALELIGSGQVKVTPEVMKFLSENLILPIAYYHCAKVMLDLARDYQDLTGEEGQASRADLARLGREAGAYGSAAGAALAYFDALITEELERAKGLSKVEAESAVGRTELTYVLAKQGVDLTESLKPGDDGPKNLLRLAAGVDAYFTSASLVNKYYALGATKTNSGELTITNRKSLTAQLEQGRLHAREAASRAKAAAGFVPVAARLDYQTATALREGDDADKLEALSSYWSSAFWSELAASLTAR